MRSAIVPVLVLAGCLDTPAATEPCPDGWVGLDDPDHCYRMSVVDGTYRVWDDASAVGCGDLAGSHLAALGSAEEQAAVLEHYEEAFHDPIWIGLRDPSNNGSWVWDGGTPVAWDGWRDGQPSNGTGEFCGELQIQDGGDVGWNDRACEDGLRYLCELDR
jgi:hypothetical protein